MAKQSFTGTDEKVLTSGFISTNLATVVFALSRQWYRAAVCLACLGCTLTTKGTSRHPCTQDAVTIGKLQ
jgi:hypothetical protein